MRKLKLLIVTEVLPPLYGGADIAAFRYASYLSQKAGYEVILLGEWNKDVTITQDAHPFVKAIKIRKWKPKNWRLKRLSELWNWWRAFSKVKQWMRAHENEFDVVHSFNSWSNLNLAAVGIGKDLGKRVLTETCLIGADDPKTLFKQKPKYWLTADRYRKEAYQKADVFVSKSSYMSSLFQGIISPNQVVEIPCFVDIELFTPIEAQDKLPIRQQLHLPEDKRIILFAGELNERKGVDLLVEAFAKARMGEAGFYLVLIGPESPNLTFRNSFSKMLEENQEFVFASKKKIIPLTSWLQASDYFCLYSFKEGLPISVTEALCVGLPVIASDIPEIEGSQVHHKKNGYIAKRGSVEALIKIFDELKNESVTDYHKLAEEATKSREKYDVNQIFLQYSQIYSTP